MQYIWFLVSILVSAEYFFMCTSGKSCEGLFCDQVILPQSNLSAYINQLMNSSTSKSPDRPVNKIAFQGVVKNEDLNKRCCYNGGTCFLGTFCICPNEYKGRHCEYEKWPQDCPGGILNGEWVVQGCSLCRCFSGRLHCLSPAAGCEEDATKSAGSKLHDCCATLFVLMLMMTFVLCTIF